MTENILDKIVRRKKEEIELAKASVSIQQLEIMPGFNRECYVLKDFLNDLSRTGIIAEFKRRSPSKGLINDTADVASVVKAYEMAGASAVSVLTDTGFFGGTADDLQAARAVLNIPLLRKDFMLDEYQLYEAKAWGADIILLIAAILTPLQIRDLSRVAKDLGMNVLLEVHNAEELERSVCPTIDAIGVNNRNLSDFSVNIETSFSLIKQIPDQFMKVSESAIHETKTILELAEVGFNGFLIGENFMKTTDPGAAMDSFVEALLRE